MLMHALAHGDTVRESALLTLGYFVYTFVLTAPQFFITRDLSLATDGETAEAETEVPSRAETPSRKNKLS